MEEPKSGFKIHEILLLSSGLAILFSLPWIDGATFWLWFSAKVVYFIGLAIFVFYEVRTYRETKSESVQSENLET